MPGGDPSALEVKQKQCLSLVEVLVTGSGATVVAAVDGDVETFHRQTAAINFALTVQQALE